jgi:hypothetical protein
VVAGVFAAIKPNKCDAKHEFQSDSNVDTRNLVKEKTNRQAYAGTATPKPGHGRARLRSQNSILI